MSRIEAGHRKSLLPLSMTLREQEESVTQRKKSHKV